ncbi:RING finger protein unkempt homolog [Engraulis encrasicolus]|uniref:RING finger protein unkempt homolog n=1 Tax=Engraulis encrasicolus TaxID=184585 RepID=UPI002FD38CF8
MSKTPLQSNSSVGSATAVGVSSSSSSSPAGGSTSPANVLHVQPEKPQHYTYLKEFRTEQCPLFVQHKCTQHRPFACFHWHFLNQRRRRPIRRRDGTFNYSPDVYCTKYDEGTGICPDGDECPFLHRTAGDTERRYHLRYYKTGSCIHETDAKGHCSKNGPHCAFAHGSHDLRSPVYDIREMQVLEAQAGSGCVEGGVCEAQSGLAASTALIERILTEEPRWQDNSYVLSHYKTELCKKPPRLCRQGYACPYYHNSKDRRRSPHKHKYRALPCPAVKHSDEWGDPSKCESAESCQYCHTRTEQQFHPEIYKSTKCNDMQQCGSCPRGPFCAFAHVEKPPISESAPLPTPTSPLPHVGVGVGVASSSSSCSGGGGLGMSSGPGEEHGVVGVGVAVAEQGLLGRVLCEEALPLEVPMSPWASEGAYCRAPGFEREDQAKQKAFAMDRHKDIGRQHSKQDLQVFLPVGSPLSFSSSVSSSLAATPPSPSPATLGPSPGMNANAMPFYPPSETVESVVESALDDLDLNDFGVSALEKSLESSSSLPSMGLIMGGNQLQSSAPVNIPGSFTGSTPFISPSPSPPVRAHHSPFLTHLSHSGQSENTFLGPAHSSLGLNGMSSNIWEHFPVCGGSPGTPPALLPPPGGSLYPEAAAVRRKQEMEEANRVLKQWDQSWRQMAQAHHERKQQDQSWRHMPQSWAATEAERERARQEQEEAQRHASVLQEAIDSMRDNTHPHTHTHPHMPMHTHPHPHSHMPLPQRLPLEALCNLQAQALYRKQRVLCVCCGEAASVSMACQHGLQCEGCAASRECPLCSAEQHTHAHTHQQQQQNTHTPP